VLAGLGVWQFFSARSYANDKERQYADYQSANVDADRAWSTYSNSRQSEQSARTRALIFGAAAGVAAIGTGWLWLRLPARPTLQVAGGGGELGLAGEW
jgi:hypothetical protein